MNSPGRRVLAISGSLRLGSSNTAVLRAAQQLAPPGMRIDLYADLIHLPYFNPDLDVEPLPPPVTQLRQLIGEADGLLICSPEYARGVAGVLKNALDWLVSGPEFPHKPVAVINASPRATHADASLKLTLTTMSARVIEPASITLPLLGRKLDADAIVADTDLSAMLTAALARLREAL